MGKAVVGELRANHVQNLQARESFQGGTRVRDAGLAQLAGLAHLQGLTSLQLLWLPDTEVTDTGLAHLAGLQAAPAA